MWEIYSWDKELTRRTCGWDKALSMECLYPLNLFQRETINLYSYLYRKHLLGSDKKKNHNFII